MSDARETAIAVSRASLIFQKRFPHVVSSKHRPCIEGANPKTDQSSLGTVLLNLCGLYKNRLKLMHCVIKVTMCEYLL